MWRSRSSAWELASAYLELGEFPSPTQSPELAQACEIYLAQKSEPWDLTGLSGGLLLIGPAVGLG